ncbi:MAG: hypothetical protein Q8S13_00120, partial [Dehalococcoidia bacterium]|nr:hypothetical protein [Dehalococcoidia bacterium]
MTAVPAAGTREPERRRRPPLARYSVSLYPVAVVAVVLIAWELGSRAGYFPRYLLPSPTGIVRRFGELHALIVKESLVTLQEILLGFGLSVVVGIPLAVGLV